MATLISCATGNFTSSSSWAVCDSTSELDSSTTQTTVGTGNTDSSTFTPGAITVDGIALKLYSRVGTTGTLTVKLRNSTDSVDVASVTVNVSDLPANSDNGNGFHSGWIFFNFGSQTLIAAKAYIVRLTTSSSNQVIVYSNSGNLSRQLRTTTTAAPASGDKLIVCGQWTAAATSNSYTITMDNTASTTFGSVSMLESLTISQLGTLTFGSSASTNYLLKIAGFVHVATGGTLNIGTSGTPIPSTSTAILDFVNTSNLDSGLRIAGGTLVTQGVTRTVWTTITSTCNSGQAVINVADVTGWAGSDEIVATATERNSGQYELRTISSIASLAVTVSSNWSNKHSGSSSASVPNTVRGQVGNLTHNVRIRGASNSLRAFIHVATNGSCTMRYTQVKWMGSAFTSFKNGISWAVTCTLDIQYCSVWAYGTITTGGSGFAAFTLSNNFFHASDNQGVTISDTTTVTAWTMSNNLQIYSSGNSGFYCQSVAGTITNNIATSNTSGFTIALGAQASASRPPGTFSGNECHNNSSYAVNIASNGSPVGFTILNCLFWRNDIGVLFNNNSFDTVIESLTAFGNSTAAVQANTTVNNLVTLRSCVFNGETSFSQAWGIYIAVFAYRASFYCESCDFSQTVAHSSNDFAWSNTPTFFLVTSYCRFGATTPTKAFSGSSNFSSPYPESYIRHQRYNRTAGDHRQVTVYGQIKTDTVIYRTASPSERLTPSEASYKLKSNSKIKSVASGATITVSVYVRKSVSGDAGGANYNGNTPRLIMRRNAALGLTSDVVLASGGGSGSFSQLTATTSATSGDDGALEFYVDCDGTAGWINVDDWSFA